MAKVEMDVPCKCIKFFGRVQTVTAGRGTKKIGKFKLAYEYLDIFCHGTDEGKIGINN